jgi:hypothetical protein
MEWTIAERQALAAEIVATTGLSLATVNRMFLTSRMADLDQFIADWDGASAAARDESPGDRSG